MNSQVRTLIIVHLSSDFKINMRREMLRALANELPASAGLICVNRPITFDVTPLKYPRKFWTGMWRYRLDAEIPGRLWVVTPRLLLHERVARNLPKIVRLNRWLMGMQLRRVIRIAYPKTDKIIQWIYHPNQCWIFDVIPGAGSVYECYDEYRWLPSGEFDSRTWRTEQETLARADLTFVTVEALKLPRKELCSRVDLLPNGVPEFFFEATRSEPDRIDSIRPPRIGYLGNARSTIDFPLLAEVFRRRPEWSLVFVGPVEQSDAVDQIRRLPNVYFLGARPQRRVPDILRRFDVALIPLRDTGYTRVMAPLKLGEYLAAGLPIVATDLPELRRFQKHVTLVPGDSDAFEQAIKDSLSLDRSSISPSLIEAARSFSWNQICRQHVMPVLNDVFRL